MFPTHCLNRFKAGSAADITGRSLESQRNDVRAGAVYTSEVHGGNRIYDVYGLAEMMIVEALAKWRMRPTDSIQIAHRVGPLVAYWALTRQGAIRGDMSPYFDACRANGIEPGRDFESDGGRIQEVKKFAVLLPGGEETYTDTLDGGPRSVDDASKLPDAAIVINIHEFGETLFLRAGKRLGWVDDPLTEGEASRLSKKLNAPPVWAKS